MYIRIKDQDEAFEFIRNQNWTPHYKSVARYRWKLRHTPDQINRRQKECPICYEKQPVSGFVKKNKTICGHSLLICQTCFDRLYTCPFCRETWKKKKENMIIFRVPLALLNDIFNRNDEDILDSVAGILQQISPEQN